MHDAYVYLWGCFNFPSFRSIFFVTVYWKSLANVDFFSLETSLYHVWGYWLLSLKSNIHMHKILAEHFISAALLCHFRIMLPILKGIVLLSKNSLPKWRELSELIHFGLVARKKSWKVLVRWVHYFWACEANN